MTLVLIFIGIGYYFQSREIRPIMKRTWAGHHHFHKNDGKSETSNTTDEATGDHRYLQAECEHYMSKNICEMQEPLNCSWCVSKTTGYSTCKTVDEAKALPPVEFTCDNINVMARNRTMHLLGGSYPTSFTDPQNAICNKIPDVDSCHADANCTYCTSQSAPSECFGVIAATTLPSGMYNCQQILMTNF